MSGDSGSPYAEPSGEQAEWLLAFVDSLHGTVFRAVRSSMTVTAWEPPANSTNGSATLRHGDVSYPIDVHAERIVDEFFRFHWRGDETVTVVCEGIGRRTYPLGREEQRGNYLIIIDPIDGSRELMYDKRSAWILTGIAISRGPATSLQDIFMSVQTELPTSKQSTFSVLSAVRGRGAKHELRNVDDPRRKADANLCPSTAGVLDDGYAVFVDFFEPGPRVPTALLAAQCLSALYPAVSDPRRARVFNDQYISTGGQMYLLATGAYRFVADLRPTLSRLANAPLSQTAHPYDLGTFLIAQEAGAIVTDGAGNELSYPLNVSAACEWVGYSNTQIKALVEPALRAALRGAATS